MHVLSTYVEVYPKLCDVFIKIYESILGFFWEDENIRLGVIFKF